MDSKDSSLTIPSDILDDLSSRFIINVPEEERCTLIRTCFQIELAHWFYLDFYCVEKPELPVCTIRNFARLIFNHIPSLKQHTAQADSIIASWQGYKHSVPTYGAILIDNNLDHVLLVQGYYARSNWSFPKGKVNKEEQPHVCAVREVMEETGFDISLLIDKNQFITHYLHDQLIKLYLVPGVPKNTKFQPTTRHEIKNIQWFPIKDLPDSKKDNKQHTLNINSLFMVIPFVRKIKKFVAQRLGHNFDDITSDSEYNTAAASSQLSTKLENENEDHLNKQQRIFAQFSANTMSSYFPLKDNARHKDARTNRSSYTPPPRMLKQKSVKQSAEFNRMKMLEPSPEIEIEHNSSHYGRPLLEFSRDSAKNNKQSDDLLFSSKTWSNFQLDSRALIACFNENMI